MTMRFKSVRAVVGVFLASCAFNSFLVAQTTSISNGPYVQLGATTSVTLVWYTNLPSANNCVQYSPTGSNWQAVCTPTQSCLPVLGCRTEVQISGLAPNTEYFYRILSGSQVLTRTCGDASQFQFQTNKPEGVPFRFVAFGDSGVGCLNECTGAETDPPGLGQCQIASRIAELDPKPDFGILVGDIVYEGKQGGDGSFQRYPPAFFHPYRNLIERIGLYPSLGNHDSDPYPESGAPYLSVFSLPMNGPQGVTPKRNYIFDYSNANFTAIDSNADPTTLSTLIAPWVAQNLQQTLKRWKFAFFHHAAYSSGSHGESADIREVLAPVFANKGADLIFQGHDHAYERIAPTAGQSHGLEFGPAYVVTGAGGAELYPRSFVRDYSEFFCGATDGFPNDCPTSQHSFTRVDIDGPNLTLKQIGANNCRMDVLNLYKPIAEGDAWRFFKGVSFPGATWMNVAYDDSAWLSGPTPSGYGGTPPYSDIQTSLSDMPGSYLTVYFRKTFTLADASQIQGVKLRLDYDDGAVAFINGVEVARANVQAGQTHLTPASKDHPAGSFETFLDISPTLLQNGVNILAVEVHNLSMKSSDFYFNADLTSWYAEPGYCFDSPQH